MPSSFLHFSFLIDHFFFLSLLFICIFVGCSQLCERFYFFRSLSLSLTLSLSDFSLFAFLIILCALCAIDGCMVRAAANNKFSSISKISPGNSTMRIIIKIQSAPGFLSSLLLRSLKSLALVASYHNTNNAHTKCKHREREWGNGRRKSLEYRIKIWWWI